MDTGSASFGHMRPIASYLATETLLMFGERMESIQPKEHEPRSTMECV